MILPPKQNPSHMKIFMSIVAVGSGFKNIREVTSDTVTGSQSEEIKFMNRIDTIRFY